MEVKIRPPDDISSSPFQTGNWYNLDIIEASLDLSHALSMKDILYKNTSYVAAFYHNTTQMQFRGVVSNDSGLPGSSAIVKRENLIEAASTWWTYGNPEHRTKCAQIYWRGWSQYCMIERVVFDIIAGEEAFEYTLSVIIHEGE